MKTTGDNVGGACRDAWRHHEQIIRNMAFWSWRKGDDQPPSSLNSQERVIWTDEVERIYQETD